MTTIASHVKNRLIQDGSIVSKVSNRVYDFDVRLAGAGESSPDLRTPEGFAQNAIIVDDRGGPKSPLAPMNAYQDTLDVVVIAPNTTQGRADMEAMVLRVMQLLIGWQEANTKALFTLSNRVGYTVDQPPRNGAMDVLTFIASGIRVGVTGT